MSFRNDEVFSRNNINDNSYFLYVRNDATSTTCLRMLNGQFQWFANVFKQISVANRYNPAVINENLLSTLLPSASNVYEVGLVYDNTNQDLCRRIETMWLNMISGFDFRNNLGPIEEDSFSFMKLAFEVKYLEKHEGLLSAALFESNVLFLSSFRDVVFSHFYKSYLNKFQQKIRKKEIPKYLIIIENSVITFHSKCCLVKQILKLVNKDSNEMLKYLKRHNRKTYNFLITCSRYIKTNTCKSISANEVNLIIKIFGKKRFQHLKAILKLNYYRSQNCYNEWDMSHLPTLLERFSDETAGMQILNFCDLLKLCYKKSNENLQAVHEHQSYEYKRSEIGVIRKIDRFWQAVDSIWPNFLDHVYDIHEYLKLFTVNNC